MNGQEQLRQPRRPVSVGDVRIGPVSLFVLVAVVCMAVLAMLAVSTASATTTMSDRMAVATEEQYRDEGAAQTFLARVDDVLGDARGRNMQADETAVLVDRALVGACEAASASSGGEVEATAHVEGRRIYAEFACENGRVLTVEVTIGDDLAYHIERWKMSAVENEEQPTGTLWTGA